MSYPEVIDGDGGQHPAIAASRREQLVVAAVDGVKSAWVTLAARLYDCHRHDDWRTLGYGSLGEWLAQADIGIERGHYYAMVRVFETFVIEHAVPVQQLAAVDVSKATEVLPAVRDGKVTPEEALADCEALTRRDLRERYARHGGAEPHHWETCPTCGGAIRVKDHA